MRLHIVNAIMVGLAVASGCGSSSTGGPNPDASTGVDSRPDGSVRTDGGIKIDGVIIPDARVDKGFPVDVVSDAPNDAPVDAAADLPSDGAVDAFVPGPVQPLKVNSGNTATYDLADGTWKVFSFDTVAGHFYCLGALDSGVDAYVGLRSSVSPGDYLEKTNYLRALNFTSFNGEKYYVAIAANGGPASGSFQIADGGDLLELGDNNVTLTAPDGDNSHFFHFSVAPGHAYTISVTGDAKKPVTLGLSPLADRSTDGQFAFPLSNTTSALPITDAPISMESMSKSTSRLYFFFVRVKETVAVKITINLAL